MNVSSAAASSAPPSASRSSASAIQRRPPSVSERRPHCWLTLTLAAAILACSAPVHARSASSSTTRRGRRGLSRLPRVALRTRGGARDEGEDAAAEEAGDADADEYDLVVIGGGSGGLACAQEAARLGMRVAVCDFVEPSPAGTTWGLGGTCVNVGCIPKKLMHQAALLGEALHDAPSFGWEARRGEAEAEPPSHAWETLVTNVQMHIKSLNFGYRSALMSADVEYVNARASFVDARTVECADAAGETRRLRAKSFVIAVGGRPRYLDDIPGGRDLVVSSDDLFSLPAAPGKTLCIGGGYVSLECAGFLNGLGMEADVMVRSIPLRGFDQQMATLVKEHMSERGCYFVDGAVPTSVERVPAAEGGGRERRRVTWRFADGSEGEGVYDTVLVAVGRDAQTARLGLENTLVRTNPRTGKVLADGERTHAGHIHAIGDVLDGKPELTPVAIQAGVRLARRLAGVASEEMDYAGVPTTVFTPLEYSCVGLSEEDAIEAHGEENIEVMHSYFKPLEWTLSHRPDNSCYAKVVCNKADGMRLLGVHLSGPGAGEIMQGFAVALKCGATLADLDGTVGIHPTCAEELVSLRITKRSGMDAKKRGC